MDGSGRIVFSYKTNQICYRVQSIYNGCNDYIYLFFEKNRVHLVLFSAFIVSHNIVVVLKTYKF